MVEYPLHIDGNVRADPRPGSRPEDRAGAEPAGGDDPGVGFISHSAEIGIAVVTLERLPDPSQYIGDVSAGSIAKLPCDEGAIGVTWSGSADGSSAGVAHATADALMQKPGLVGVDRAQGEDGLGENSVSVDRGHP